MEQERIKRDREAREEARERDAEFVASGGHIVALNRCWECGITKILGEIVGGRLQKMPYAVWREAEDLRRHGHARDAAKVPPGTILSSIGFDAPPSERFEFRVVSEDYDDC